MDMHFAGVHRLIFSPIFIIFGLMALRNCFKVLQAFKLIAHPLTQTTVFPRFSKKILITKTCFQALAMLFLLFAWLQPQWGKVEQNIVQEGRDLLIMLDVSRSMLAEDITPSRLDFAKLKIRNLLDQLPVDRVGLVLFSGSAFLQCPLTSDRAAFLLFLDQVDAHSISSGTTAIDAALTKAIETFSINPDRKNKLALMITDGEDFSTNLTTVKNKAAEINLTLFVMGVGTTEGAPVPIINFDGKKIGHESDSNGSIVLTKLNEPFLKAICADLKGTYLHASYEDHDVSLLINHVKKFEKEKFNDKKISLYEEQYHWFLGIAWIFLALEWVL